jgi:hypothetical protein
MTIENQEQETQEFETENTELENEQEAEAETKQEEAEEESEEQGEEEKKGFLKDFRKREREKDKENRELKRRLAAYEANPSDENLELPKKPKLAEFDYDDDAYEKALDNWHSQKQKIESVKQTQQQQIAQQQAEFNTKLQAYNENVTKLNIDRSKFTEAEEVVKSIFDAQQQSIMVLYAKDPTKLVYSLGRDEDIAEDLAKITDPIKFAVAIARHEGNLNMKPTKTVPQAERKVNAGANAPAVSADKKLAQLRTKAEQTSNYTELLAYKKTLKGK